MAPDLLRRLLLIVRMVAATPVQPQSLSMIGLGSSVQPQVQWLWYETAAHEFFS